MRLFSVCLLWSACAFAAQPPSLAGKWQVHLSVSGYESSMDCEFTQEGAEMKGKCTSENGSVEVKGKVDGKNVQWTFTSEYNNEKHDVLMKGVLESESKAKGTVEVPAYGVEGEFTATRKQ